MSSTPYVLRAAVAVSGYGQPPGTGNGLSPKGTRTLRRVLVDGVLTADAARDLATELSSRHSERLDTAKLFQFPEDGFRLPRLPEYSDIPIRDGLYEDVRLSVLAEHRRAALLHIASDRWNQDSAARKVAMRTLLGMPIGERPQAATLELRGDMIVYSPGTGGPHPPWLDTDWRVAKTSDEYHIPWTLHEALGRNSLIRDINPEVFYELQDRTIPPWRSTAVGTVRKGRTIRVSRDGKKLLIKFPKDRELGGTIRRLTAAFWQRNSGLHIANKEDVLGGYEFLVRSGFRIPEELHRWVEEAERGIVEWEAYARAHAHPLRGAADAEIRYLSADGKFPDPGHQRADLAYTLDMIASDVGMGLYLDMGLGKTFVSVAAYDILRKRCPELRMLVLGPGSAGPSWASEVRDMLPATRFFTYRKTGRSGLNRMREFAQIPRDDRYPILAILDGQPKNRREALALNPEIVFSTYTTTVNSCDELVDWVHSGGPVLLVADEMHRIQNPDAKTSKAAVRLAMQDQCRGPYGGRIGLTGSPAPQNLNQVYGQALFLDRGPANCRFGPSSRAFYLRNFDVSTGPEGNWFSVGDPLDRRRAEYVSSVMFDYGAIRREKDEELDLPGKIALPPDVAYLEGGAELRVYQTLRNHLKAQAKDGDQGTLKLLEDDPARAFLRMRQFLSHPRNLLKSLRESQDERSELEAAGELVGEDGEEVRYKNDDLFGLPDQVMKDLERLCKKGYQPPKLRLLVDLVSDVLNDPTEKVVIGYSHQATGEAIEEALRDYSVLHFGGGGMEARTEAKDRFQSDPGLRVFLGNSQAISEGLTLTAARNMILYDAFCAGSAKTWIQLQDRIYRRGQTRRAFVRHLVTGNTIELSDLSVILQRAKAQATALGDKHTDVIDQLRNWLEYANRRPMDLLEEFDGRMD